MSIVEIPDTQRSRTLEPGEVLIAEGDPGGNIFILVSGSLAVERGGVALATISQPNALVGEMSVLLDSGYSATVRAADHAVVRTIHNADRHLIENPELCLELAVLLARRLETTSALVVELTKQDADRGQKGLLARIVSALTGPADGSQYVTRHDLFET